MTDAERYVLSIYPRASCFETNLYWPGQGSRRRWIVTKSPYSSVSEGEGLTEIEAWARAANRIEAKQKQKTEEYAMTRLEELAQKHFPLVAYDEALEFGRELLEECARIADEHAEETPSIAADNAARLIAEAIRALAEESKKK